MEIVAERIRMAMNLRNMRQVDVVQSTGINKGSLSSYLSGKYEPKQNNIFLLAQALNVNEAWLMGHDVPMEIVEDTRMLPPNVMRETSGYRTDEEQNLVSYFNSLNETGKKEALKRIYELTCIDTYKAEKNT